MPFANGLGSKYDLAVGVVPVDTADGASTGKRVFMGHADAVDVVIIKGAGTSEQTVTATLKQHTAASAGTSSDLEIIDRYFVKQDSDDNADGALDGNEVWAEVTQAAAATVETTAEEEQLIVFTVSKDQLDAGNKYISVDLSVADGDTPDPQLATVLYVFHGLGHKDSPTVFLSPLR